MIRGIFILGIDGATWKVMEPLVSEGKLPHIAALREHGVWGDLQSIPPYVSPPAWTSLVTGKRPGRHAILDFISKIPGQYGMRLSKGGERGSPALWSILSNHGLRCCVVNVTMSFPPDPIHGIMVSGLDCPWQGAIATYPKEFAGKLLSAVPNYSVMPPKVPLSQRRERLRTLIDMTQIRTQAGLYLAQKEPWDFFMIQFSATDVAQHFYWTDWDPKDPRRRKEKPVMPEALPEVYEQIDRALGQMLEYVDPKALILLVSDHGFGPMHTLFLVNPWLARYGYLRPARERQLRPLLSKVARRLLGNSDLAKMDWAPKVDWKKTKIYCAGTCGNLFMNLMDREPWGVLKPSDKMELAEEMRERLLAIRQGPNEESPVAKVVDGGSLFHGPFSALAPDLWLEMSRGFHAVGSLKDVPYAPRGKGDGLFSDRHPWNGNHEPEGILIMKGPGLLASQRISNAVLIDIVPTVLRWLDLPVPKDVEGRCLEEVFHANFLADRPLRISEPLGSCEGEGPEDGEDEKQEMTNRLRDLGYLG